ncbi:unnamed protein product [Adineta steineri]|uniref:Uncharacterized protein n=1 Tax=Adineta steineri TaxID=433720 RepID=A0A815P9G3_9BILA|nr:unnamed protein product [Adineta steineri]CAF1445992.1 unnamed protein product [Adineta steineri]
MQLLSIRNIIVVLALCTMQICLSQAACDCQAACDKDDTVDHDECYAFCARNTLPLPSCMCADNFTTDKGQRCIVGPQPVKGALTVDYLKNLRTTCNSTTGQSTYRALSKVYYCICPSVSDMEGY